MIMMDGPLPGCGFHVGLLKATFDRWRRKKKLDPTGEGGYNWTPSFFCSHWTNINITGWHPRMFKIRFLNFRSACTPPPEFQLFVNQPPLFSNVIALTRGQLCATVKRYILTLFSETALVFTTPLCTKWPASPASFSVSYLAICSSNV